MISISISWTDLKGKLLPIRYARVYGNYYLVSVSETAEYSCVIAEGSSESTDFENNYKEAATNLL